jgi:hypothetical protein
LILFTKNFSAKNLVESLEQFVVDKKGEEFWNNNEVEKSNKEIEM